jgi:hypothetical protein
MNDAGDLLEFVNGGGLTAACRQAFGIEAAACACIDPMAESRLTPGESEAYAKLSHPDRRKTWLTGRAALKGALRAVGRAEDTSLLCYPGDGFSLTHSGGVAVAVASRCEKGLGVDLERLRPVKAEAARFFLGMREQALDGADLLRLWTVKEAVFKSDRRNGGRLLRDYRLAEPRGLRGTASGPRPGSRYGYVSRRWENWWLSLAAEEG